MTDQLWTSFATMAPQIESRPQDADELARDTESRARVVTHGQKADALTKTIRIGAVSYLNSKPLVEDLSRILPMANVSLDYPSHLADDLAAGRIDVGLIPSVEAFRNPDYEILSDACVATRGAPTSRASLAQSAIASAGLQSSIRVPPQLVLRRPTGTPSAACSSLPKR